MVVSKAYDDCPRLDLGYYGSTLVPFYVNSLMSRLHSARSIDRTMELFGEQLRVIRPMFARGFVGDVSCCAITPGTAFFSKNCFRPIRKVTSNQLRIMEVLSSLFGISYRVVSCDFSSRSRIFDLRGREEALRAFIPLYDFVTRAYELVFFLYQYSLRGVSKREKQEYRVLYTNDFVDRLKLEILNVIGHE